jgi:hypothetical protein
MAATIIGSVDQRAPNSHLAHLGKGDLGRAGRGDHGSDFCADQAGDEARPRAHVWAHFAMKETLRPASGYDDMTPSAWFTCLKMQ